MSSLYGNGSYYTSKKPVGYYDTLQNIYDQFDKEDLRTICGLHEDEVGKHYGIERFQITEQQAPNDFYYFKDNGSDILAVAHLDTVGDHEERAARFVQTAAAGMVVYSRALDDRLGAFIILYMLPALGINVDVLLTVGEESGSSTAAFFVPPEGKQYNWMIEFDRGGRDVVMYEYENKTIADMVRESGARVGQGSFSDICYATHLGVKGFNWGVGYADYHGPRAHAYLDDTFEMLAYFVDFHSAWHDVHLPHTPTPKYKGRYGAWSGGAWGAGGDGWAGHTSGKTGSTGISGSTDSHGKYGNAEWWDSELARVDKQGATEGDPDYVDPDEFLCVSHGGAWGDDLACRNCVDDDGWPHPIPAGGGVEDEPEAEVPADIESLFALPAPADPECEDAASGYEGAVVSPVEFSSAPTDPS